MVDEKTATLIGLHIGDGYLDIQKVKWKNKTWVNRRWNLNAGLDKDFVENVKKLVESFGFSAKIRIKDKKYFLVECAGIWRIIQKYFPEKKYFNTVDIPKIFTKKWHVAKNVLKGIFSSDGCVAYTDNYSKVYISFDTKSEKLARSIFKLLKRQNFSAHFIILRGEIFQLEYLRRKILNDL